jgi:tetratricopeptide (TPR) repeat protein
MSFCLFGQNHKKAVSTTIEVNNARTAFRLIINYHKVHLGDNSKSKIDSFSKALIKIDIPANTNYWYYIFSTNNVDSLEQNLGISDQISDILNKAPMTCLDSIFSDLKITKGSDPVDIFYLDKDNSELFIHYDTSKIVYYSKGSVINHKEGIEKIDKIDSLPIYLGIRKSSYNRALNVDFEVVFVCSSEKTNPLFLEFVNKIFTPGNAISSGNEGWSAFQKGHYDECLRLSKKALELDNSLGWVHFNIALVYLVQGNNHRARKKYNEAIDVTLKEISIKHDLEGAIDDLKTYMHLFPSKKVAYKILNRLTAVATKYNK